MFEFIKLTKENVLEIALSEQREFSLDWFLNTYSTNTALGLDSYYCPNYRSERAPQERAVIATTQFLDLHPDTCVIVNDK